MASIRFPPKRLIVCCDGTWFNSDDGYNKPIFGKKRGALQVPSNVTRISRCFKRTCDDGRVQIINYQSGIGTGSNTADTLIGGAFGSGISMVEEGPSMNACLAYAPLTCRAANQGSL